MNQEFLLITFNDEKGVQDKIIESLLTSSGKKADCGMMSMAVFSTDRTKEEIHAILTQAKLEFFLTEKNNMTYNLPNEIKDFLETDTSAPFGVNISIDKLSIEEQMKMAVKNQDFELAALLRDKIQSKKISS